VKKCGSSEKMGSNVPCCCERFLKASMAVGILGTPSQQEAVGSVEKNQTCRDGTPVKSATQP
jgi:hypothetical protein